MINLEIINIYIFAAFFICGMLVCAYYVMHKFIKMHEIKTDKMKFIQGFFFIEMPSKYSDAYRAKYGKMGPGIKLLILSMVLFFVYWLSIAGLLIADLGN